ncbi:MAG: hypothetical protein ACJ8OJ_03975 [Povalibacter sp.]
MKIRTTLAALALLVTGTVLAEPHGPPPGGSRDIERLAILLDLDEGQKTSVKQVLDEQSKERSQLWAKAKESQTRPSHEEMHAQHEKMRQETIEKLRPILSDQQMTKFQALTEAPMGPHRDHPHPDKPE